MPFRSSLLAVAASVLLCVPAWAQEGGAAAAAAPAPTPEAQRAMWCGVAFTIAGESARSGGDAEAAATLAEKASAALGLAAAELIPNGMTVDQFRALAEKTAAAVTAPFRQTSFTEAECDDVVAAAPQPTPQ